MMAKYVVEPIAYKSHNLKISSSGAIGKCYVSTPYHGSTPNATNIEQ